MAVNHGDAIYFSSQGASPYRARAFRADVTAMGLVPTMHDLYRSGWAKVDVAHRRSLDLIIDPFVVDRNTSGPGV